MPDCSPAPSRRPWFGSSSLWVQYIRIDPGANEIVGNITHRGRTLPLSRAPYANGAADIE
jgi:hypothetical protein